RKQNKNLFPLQEHRRPTRPRQPGGDTHTLSLSLCLSLCLSPSIHLQSPLVLPTPGLALRPRSPPSHLPPRSPATLKTCRIEEGGKAERYAHTPLAFDHFMPVMGDPPEAPSWAEESDARPPLLQEELLRKEQQEQQQIVPPRELEQQQQRQQRQQHLARRSGGGGDGWGGWGDWGSWGGWGGWGGDVGGGGVDPPSSPTTPFGEWPPQPQTTTSSVPTAVPAVPVVFSRPGQTTTTTKPTTAAPNAVPAVHIIPVDPGSNSLSSAPKQTDAGGPATGSDSVDATSDADPSASHSKGVRTNAANGNVGNGGSDGSKDNGGGGFVEPILVAASSALEVSTTTTLHTTDSAALPFTTGDDPNAPGPTTMPGGASTVASSSSSFPGATVAAAVGSVAALTLAVTLAVLIHRRRQRSAGPVNKLDLGSAPPPSPISTVGESARRTPVLSSEPGNGFHPWAKTEFVGYANDEDLAASRLAKLHETPLLSTPFITTAPSISPPFQLSPVSPSSTSAPSPPLSPSANSRWADPSGWDLSDPFHWQEHFPEPLPSVADVQDGDSDAGDLSRGRNGSPALSPVLSTFALRVTRDSAIPVDTDHFFTPFSSATTHETFALPPLVPIGGSSSAGSPIAAGMGTAKTAPIGVSALHHRGLLPVSSSVEGHVDPFDPPPPSTPIRHPPLPSAPSSSSPFSSSTPLSSSSSSSSSTSSTPPRPLGSATRVLSHTISPSQEQRKHAPVRPSPLRTVTVARTPSLSSHRSNSIDYHRPGSAVSISASSWTDNLSQYSDDTLVSMD
ncbi:hypothetical protein DFJ73DRAFT_894136, partial [Zopfochytrium polystomum]